jgi:hypothetical protein
LWEGTLIFTIEALVSVKQAKFLCGSPAHTYFADLFVLSLSCALFYKCIAPRGRKFWVRKRAPQENERQCCKPAARAR